MTDTPHPADWAEYHAHMEDEDELDRLRAENERLRGANKLMNDCLEELCTCGESPYSHECLPCDAIIAAREALEVTDG